VFLLTDVAQRVAMGTDTYLRELLHYVGYVLKMQDLERNKKTDYEIAITFLAQWHPLIQPRMTGLKPGYAAGS